MTAVLRVLLFMRDAGIGAPIPRARLPYLIGLLLNTHGPGRPSERHLR